MPPRLLGTAYLNVFNGKVKVTFAWDTELTYHVVTTLLNALPTASRSQALTKCSSCLFSTTAPQQMKRATKKKKKKHIDPYRLAQARQRRAANVARQNVLFQERAAAMGDPVRSRPTPFVDSLHPKADVESIKQAYLNYFVRPDQMAESVARSKDLTSPLPTNQSISEMTMLQAQLHNNRESHQSAESVDPTQPSPAEQEPAQLERQARFDVNHKNAVKAMELIASLDNASGKDRLRVNVQRCIKEFGRHFTDEVLPPKPPSLQYQRQLGNSIPEALPARSGPDTGSSEVQVAVLTAKINVLMENLHKKDKHNKRNLRLLVHRRQKLLAYLRRKERGGPRWQNVVEKLGINDAMWQGEISLA